MQFSQVQAPANAQKKSACQSASCIELEKSKLSPYIKCDWEKAKHDHAAFNSTALMEYLETRKARGLPAWQPTYENVADALLFYVEKMNSYGFARSPRTILMSQVFEKKTRNCETSCRMCADFLSSLGLAQGKIAIFGYMVAGSDISQGHAILGVAGKYFNLNGKELTVQMPAEARKVAGHYIEYPLSGYGAADCQIVCSALENIADEKMKNLESHKADAKYTDGLQQLINSGLFFSAGLLKDRQDDWMLSYSYAHLQEMAMDLRGALGDNEGAQQHMTESFNAIQNALRTNPVDASARFMRGKLLQRSRNYKEALEDFRFVYGKLSSKDPLKQELSEGIRRLEALLSTPKKQ